MPSRLIAKRPSEPSPGEAGILLVMIGGPAAALWYCFNYNKPIHANDPWLNIAAHTMLLALPLIWTAMIYWRPVVYEAAPDETVLEIATFWNRCRSDWWQMFVLWATPAFVIADLARVFATKYLAHPESLSTSPGKATAILIVMTLLALLYGAIVLNRASPAIWMSKDGLRTSILRFHPWKNLDHYSGRGDAYTVFHRANSAMPLGTFHVSDPETRAMLDNLLLDNQVPLSNAVHPAFTRFKAVVVSGFLVNVAFSCWLRLGTNLPFLAVVLISFGVAIAQTLVLERYRGVSKYGRYAPVIEPPPEL